LTPPEVANDLALRHQHLGSLYGEVGDLDRALPHHNEAIRYFEAAENPYDAAQTRVNVAYAFARTGRFDDALLFAQAALRGFTELQAEEDIQRTKRLIAQIERYIQKAKGGSIP